MNNLIFVDCEAVGPCPSMGTLTEFGAVEYKSGESFHGRIWYSVPSPENPAIPVIVGNQLQTEKEVFSDFAIWVERVCSGRPTFVSDNPAYDWQWINDGFWRSLGYNPFGFSARRISDFYAGLCNDFSRTQGWKRLRVTKHDHNPVHDALGNVEAVKRLLAGER